MDQYIPQDSRDVAAMLAVKTKQLDVRDKLREQLPHLQAICERIDAGQFFLGLFSDHELIVLQCAVAYLTNELILEAVESRIAGELRPAP